jgi:hypothetical protein
VTQLHSGREYISVLENYTKVVGGPTPSQIASSLGMVVGLPKYVEFVAQPKSRRGSTQIIGGVIISAKTMDRIGPSWVLIIADISMPGTNNIVQEREIKIYYHSSGEGIILAE